MIVFDIFLPNDIKMISHNAKNSCSEEHLTKY